MSHGMRLKNFSRHIVDLQRAKECGDVRVTTEEAGLVIVRPNIETTADVLVAYNLYIEKAYVMVYRHLDLIETHETNQPLTLARTLCGKYQRA